MPGKILLAEDDANLRETLAEVLRNEGYEVLTASNGQAALEAMSTEDVPQVLVVDGLLPKVSGHDVCKFVRGRGLDTPIIFMSGVFKTQDQQKDVKEKYQVKTYLTKPFDAARLVDAVRPLLFGGAGGAAGGGAASQQQPLPGEGSLIESPVLYLLWRAAKEVHTGVLELFGDRDRARVFVFKGRAVLAQHSDPQLNVGVELIRDGVIDAQTYKQACELALSRGAGLYDILKGEGWATDAQAKAGYKALVPRVLEKIAAFNGRFRWVATDSFANLVPTSATPLIEPLLAGLRRATERELDAHVAPRRPLRLAPGDAWADVVRRLPEACGSDSLVRAINGRATIAQMLEAASSPTERAARYRQVYLLMSTMAVRASMEVIPMAAGANSSTATGPQKPVQVDAPTPAPEPRPQPQRAPEPQRPAVSPGGAGPGQAAGMHPPPRTSTSSGVPGVARAPVRPVIDEGSDRGVIFSPEENEARAKIGAKFDEIDGKDYFAIMGVKKGAADANTVKKAYFALAKDFHTDAFAGLNLGTAQKKLDHVFQSIQTAYTTLSDDKKRGEYEAKLNFEEQGASTDLAALMQADSEMHKARTLVERGEYQSALKIVVEKVLPIQPKSDEALGYQKYLTWWTSGKSAGGAVVVMKALDDHFKNQQGALALKEFQGRVALEIGDMRAAKNAFRKVLELDPKHAGALAASRAMQRKIEEEEKKASSGLGKLFKR